MQNVIRTNKNLHHPLQNDDVDLLLLDVDEVDVPVKLSRKKKKSIICEHIKYDLSISKLCQLIGCSRDFYHSIKRKAKIKSGSVNYIQLAERTERIKNAELTKGANRIREALHAKNESPDEEW
jgi:hypothetical protein